MPFEVVLPRLGWNMEAGQVGEWLKRDGDSVTAGEILFTVEGDKATQEVEALESGILRIPPDSPPPGKEVPVGTLLAYLVAPDEADSFAFASAAPAAAAALPAIVAEVPPTVSAAPADDTTGASAAQFSATGDTPAISPRARRIARELDVDWGRLKGSGRTGRIVERDVRQAATQSLPAAYPADAVSPVARRVAADLQVDADALAAQRPGQRIRRADVEQLAARTSAEKPAVATTQPATARPGTDSADTILPISPVRRIIAERMAASTQTTAPVTLTTEVDATELVRLRQELRDDARQPLPAYNDILAVLVARALLEHPMLNARLEGDTIIQAGTVHIGLAVDTPRGLLVPVLRDVQTKSLRGIAQESAALIEKARNGRASTDELQGATFSITNLGMYEIDAFTPVINLPECAILGVGRILPKPVVVDTATERIAVRQMMFLSLTFDHRLVDGAPAARFLQRVKQYIAKPYLWLAG